MHCRALLGLKNGVEGMFTPLFTSLLLKASSSFHLPVQRRSTSLVLLSVFIFPFHAFLHVYQFGQVTCVIPRLGLAVDFSLLLG